MSGLFGASAPSPHIAVWRKMAGPYDPGPPVNPGQGASTALPSGNVTGASTPMTPTRKPKPKAKGKYRVEYG